MIYNVYIIKTVNSKINKTYVGYTKDLKQRLDKHNSNKGARSTRGHKWVLIYKKKFISKTDAMSYEYHLKKNRKKEMKLLKSVNKIAIILPYKEIYSENFSGAASIWVKDYFKKSILSNSTYIYGSLDKGLKPITKNFTNLNISDYSFSKTKNYIKKFYIDHLKKDFDIIEIHNRPEYLNFLIGKKIKSKLIFFFIIIHKIYVAQKL